MMYDMSVDAPPPGSPLESVFILLWQMREDIEYYRSRVLVQASMAIDDKYKAAEDAWKEFTNKFYPYLEGEQKRSDKVALDYLLKEVKRGGLAVRPLEPLIKSKLAGRRRKAAEDGDQRMSGVREREG